MKILLVNGSPRGNGGSSQLIIKYLEAKLNQSNEVTTVQAIKFNVEAMYKEIAVCDVVVFVFPLYVDGIPSHLLNHLWQIKDWLKDKPFSIKVFCVVNNGFYDAIQNRIAIEMVKNFAIATHLQWGYGLGIGAGGMLDAAPIGKGPLYSVGFELDRLSENIVQNVTQDNKFVQPNFPRFLYKFLAHLNWKIQGKRNGLKQSDLLNRH